MAEAHQAGRLQDELVKRVAAAMIDCLVHDAEVISMKGGSYRIKDRDLGRVPAASKTND